jgi:heavy metal sensor kinase
MTATRYDGPGKPPRAEDLPIDIDSPSAAIVVARPMTDIDETLAQLLKTLVIICPLALILSGWGGIYLARRAFSPVEQITRTAQEIQAHDLTRRIEVHSADELGRLAATINDMLERLAGAFERQSQFTSDASHELRSPLAVIEAESTLALQKHRSPEEYEQSMEIIAQEAAQMSALINQLLTLARADAGKEQMKYEKVDLREFLEELCVDAEILCREKELELKRSLEEKVCVSADLRSLRRLMHNLLSNAIHYTSSGGTVTIELLKEGSQALLRVSDTGMGIPEEDLPHIFERFYRVDKARARDEGGSGLGLAMCRHIVEAHRGRIDVESRPGKGSSFTVRLPLHEGD